MVLPFIQNDPNEMLLIVYIYNLWQLSSELQEKGEGPWVVPFQNCVYWSGPISKLQSKIVRQMKY